MLCAAWTRAAWVTLEEGLRALHGLADVAVTIASGAPRGQTLIATVRAYAKLNLTLEVFGRRPDGYHDLRSLIVGIDWYDDVRGVLTTGPGIEFRCDRAELAGKDNLVYLAAYRLAERFGPAPGVALELGKRLPIGAGLGGGSSDAAAALAVCNHLWALGLSRDELSRVGAEIGSDVALFFSLPCAVMTGRGECVGPAAMSWSGWAVLVSVGTFVSTAEVYKAWRPGDKGGCGLEALETAMTAGTAEELSACLFNDLEPAVFRVSPEVEECCARLEGIGLGKRVRVAGAGSVLYLLEDDQEAARAVADDILDQGIGVATRIARILTNQTLVVREE